MPLKFRKVLIADERYEAAEVFDINGDGIPDIVSGTYWYEGPDFRNKHAMDEIKPIGEYYDSFITIPMDVNGDGHMDVINGSWWGPLRWRENPGPDGGEWKEHLIAECGNIETGLACDVDGCGVAEIVPNTPGAPLVAYKLVVDADGKGTGKFEAHVLYSGAQGHGLGFGDVNGDGRPDFIMAHGWLEAPEDPWSGQWTYHPGFNFGGASVPILAVDVNGDGLPDLIVGQGHDYGLDWYEQGRDADGGVTWTRHPIDPYVSQYHTMHWVDIDGDGACELVTGVRYRAHCGHDPGDYDDVGIFYFKWNGESFTKQVIDYGPAREATGCGILFAVTDLTGNGLLDIVAPGKDGLYVFYNEGLSTPLPARE